MQIEKITRTFYNKQTKQAEEKQVYRITFKTLMVMEESLDYAFKKMIMFAVYKKLLIV